MKQLLLTFFGVILCYSLFFDKEAEKPAVDGINYIQRDFRSPNLHYISPDTMTYLAFYNNNPVSWRMDSNLSFLYNWDNKKD
jgi:hypothetical protein